MNLLSVIGKILYRLTSSGEHYPNQVLKQSTQHVQIHNARPNVFESQKKTTLVCAPLWLAKSPHNNFRYLPCAIHLKPDFLTCAHTTVHV